MLKWSPFVALSLAGAGILYQTIAAAADRRNFPAPGRLVDVGGFYMHLQCSGERRPTVVLDAGNGGISSTWAWVQPRVAQDARVCAFDRAGLGWSHAGSSERDAVTVSRELKALLDAAGESGPFVYVGHSLGGIYARVFAAEYPELVAGLVLVDASHPEQFARYPEDILRQVERYNRVMRLTPRAAHLGIMRATNFLGRMAEGLPEPDYSRTAAMAALASHFRVANAEFGAWERNAERLADAADLGDLPLTVVTAGVAPGAPHGLLETHHDLQRDLAALSSRSRHEIVAGADHLSLLMRSEHAERTAGAIRELLAVVRGEELQERRMHGMAHEFTRSIHHLLVGLSAGWERSIARTLLSEGFANRTEQVVFPGGMESGNGEHRSGCFREAEARRDEMLRGILSHLRESSADQVMRSTLGSGTTGLEREAYCAGWVVVGGLVAQGHSLAELARVPEDDIPVLAERAIRQVVDA